MSHQTIEKEYLTRRTHKLKSKFPLDNASSAKSKKNEKELFQNIVKSKLENFSSLKSCLNSKVVSAIGGPNAIRKEKKAKEVKIQITRQKKFINLRDKNFKKKDLQFNFLSQDQMFQNRMSSNFQDYGTIFSSFSTSATSSIYKRHLEDTTMDTKSPISETLNKRLDKKGQLKRLRKSNFMLDEEDQDSLKLKRDNRPLLKSNKFKQTNQISSKFEQFEQKIKFRSLHDTRKKEEFALIDESQYDSLFNHPVLKKQKMIVHECDNDYNSDEEQVQNNKNTLFSELSSAIAAFVKKDPISLIENLETPLNQKEEDAERQKKFQNLSYIMDQDVEMKLESSENIKPNQKQIRNRKKHIGIIKNTDIVNIAQPHKKFQKCESLQDRIMTRNMLSNLSFQDQIRNSPHLSFIFEKN